MSKQLGIHLWAPAAFRFGGGISVFSRHLLKAVEQLNPEAEVEAFLKNDVAESHDEHGVRVRCHTAGRFSGHLRTLVFFCQVLFWGIVKRPDLIIATHIRYGFLADWIRRLTGADYWIVAHGTESWNLKSQLSRRSLLNADRVLAVSNYTRDRLLNELPLAPGRVVVFPNTFDADSFRIAAKPAYLARQLRLRADQPVMLTVCRLYQRYKGCEKVIRAMTQLCRKIPHLHYVIVGEGPDRTRLEQIVAQCGLQSCVTLVGYVDNEQLGDYYNLCDLFVMPSKGEGFGIVFLEAMACGKPAIGGNQDGAAEPLAQGRLGVLANPDDGRAIATAISGVMQRQHPNPILYDPARLRRTVIERFGFTRFCDNLTSLVADFSTRRMQQPCMVGRYAPATDLVAELSSLSATTAARSSHKQPMETA